MKCHHGCWQPWHKNVQLLCFFIHTFITIHCPHPFPHPHIPWKSPSLSLRTSGLSSLQACSSFLTWPLGACHFLPMIWSSTFCVWIAKLSVTDPKLSRALNLYWVCKNSVLPILGNKLLFELSYTNENQQDSLLWCCCAGTVGTMWSLFCLHTFCLKNIVTCHRGGVSSKSPCNYNSWFPENFRQQTVDWKTFL